VGVYPTPPTLAQLVEHATVEVIISPTPGIAWSLVQFQQVGFPSTDYYNNLRIIINKTTQPQINIIYIYM
jgi:hypothetical protein